jgi:hypothetical protein
VGLIVPSLPASYTEFESSKRFDTRSYCALSGN